MSRYRFNPPVRVGQRNIKTALAATVCALAYLLIDRNPTFACIGAIFGIGNSMDNSRLHGGNRFFGTLIGGLLGLLLFRVHLFICPDGRRHFLLLPLLFVGVVLLILISQLCHWSGAVQPGGVILCILLFNTPADSYVSYCLNRIVDTGIGVAVALFINWALPRGRLSAILNALKRKDGTDA